MSEKVPSQFEQPLCSFKALYLGTAIFMPYSKNFDESALNLAIVQDCIAERYPTNGESHVHGK
jgi:hypothetical protein